MIDEGLPERARLHEHLDAHVQAVGQTAAVGTLSARVLASWQRCEVYGIPLDDVEPVFNGTLDQDSLFYECGGEVLTGLQRTLDAEPISLMLADADGVVLSRVGGDKELQRSLDAVHLAPGFGYAERDAGTNGLGLALADRTPTLVRADEHYALSLCRYTCAAAPVFDPLTGRLEGSVNLTTWARSSSELLLALAQSAAGNTAALMLVRGRGGRAKPAPRDPVFRVEHPHEATSAHMSAAWEGAVDTAHKALSAGRIIAAVGEPGSGRSTLLAQAMRRTDRRLRILIAGAPEHQDLAVWLSLWTTELGRPSTAMIAVDVDTLPTWVAERLRDLVVGARRLSRAATGEPVVNFSVSALRYEDIPAALAALVDTIVDVPPLRDRPEDVLPLAHEAARRVRGRDVDLTPAAQHALCNNAWPGNVAQLRRAVTEAAKRTDVIDVRHLPPEVFANSTHRLSRIEAFERDEIVRTLSESGITMQAAARRLGMSRATLYRKVGQYDVHVQRTSCPQER